MNAEIISIGTELLLGEIVDTNSAHIARNFRDIGVNLYFTTTVGDNEARIVEALEVALERADLVITTGGLGPTVDDVTRQAVAAATHRPLVFHQELLDQIAERFARFGSQMSENNRQQAYIPQDALPVENPVGTAPCYIVESEQGVIISLPGVPREMKYLLDTAVLPYLREHFNLKSVIKARVLRTAGIGESQIDEAITDLMKLHNPTVGLAAHIGQTDVRITAKAEDSTVADNMIAEVEATIRQRLAGYIYGVEKDRIEDALVAELAQRQMKLALSETGTGDRLARRLAEAVGESPVLAGTAQFDTQSTLLDTLQIAADATPEQLGLTAAQAACDSSGADIGIAVIADNEVTIIGVVTPDLRKSRVYRFGAQAVAPAIWAGSWGMALTWRWLKKQG